MIVRACVGFVLAAVIAFIARRLRSLSAGGAVAATLVGTCAVAAGWSWGALLVLYFASSTALSHLGRAVKEARTASIAAKGGERDAVQVVANGVMFAVAAAMMCIRPDVMWIGLGAGTLAASAADTWATEIGTRYGGEPRSILTWRTMPAGTSGAVTVIGSLAAIGGAAFIAVVLLILGWTPVVARYVFIGGVIGAAVDSVLGATVQARRWCEACTQATERPVHTCGTATRAAGGIAWLDNDMVNFISGLAGGLFAAILVQ